MGKKQRNVPKLRFPEFTREWELRKISDLICEYKETVDSNCTLPVLTSSKTEGVILQEEHFGRKQLHDITGYNILPRNYCTYRNRSDGVDFTFNINKCCDKGIISKFYPVFYGKNSNIHFISLMLNNSDEVVREIGYTCVGTGQKVLSFTDLQKIKIRVPSLEEQNIISDFLTSFDTLITLQQRKLDQIKEYKKGMLQKMFPKDGESVPEVRFPGFSGEWELRKFGDIAKRQSDSMVSDDENPCVEFEDVIAEQGILNKDIYAKGVFKKGIRFTSEDVLYGKLRPYLHNWLNPDFAGVAVGDWWVLRPIKTDKDFLYRLIQTAPYDEAANQSSGTKMPRADWTLVSNTEFSIPASLDEQSKIADVFDGLDHLITLHQRKLEAMKEYKKGLLQQMFV